MSTSKALTTLVAAATSLLVVQGQETIVDYTPENPVHDIMNIAYDLQAIGDVLEDTHKPDFDGAFRIYQQGGHSESVAKLELTAGLNFFLDKGAIVTGTSIEGKKVTGTALKDYKIGDKNIEIFYNQDHPCSVGGLKDPKLEGCFKDQGELTIVGQTEPIVYFYNEREDNYNLRTLQMLSKEAEQEFKVDGVIEQGFFNEFAKFEDYYGSATYADDIMTAVFRGTKHEFDKHTFDFSGWNNEDRIWFAERGPDFMNIAMHVVGQLEQAKNTCTEGCAGDCNAEALEHLDRAVAFYTGALYEDRHEGNMLYGLADQMCKLFKTCGWRSDNLEGTSHVNLLSFAKFKDAQAKMKEGKCEEADVDMRVVAKMVFVPLWQGLLYASYHKLRKEGTVFAVATLPILAHCSPGYVEKIYGYFLPDSDKAIHFPYMKKIMEDHYHCIMLDCQTVGGLWNNGKQEYVCLLLWIKILPCWRFCSHLSVSLMSPKQVSWTRRTL